MNKDNNKDHWKLGIFYYNKDNTDPAVEKRHGIGITPNFGSKTGIIAFIAVFVPHLILIILLIIFFSLRSK